MSFIIVNVLFTTVVALAAFLYAWTRISHSLPELRGWHIDAPAAEFTAADARAAYSFDDYLEQERRTFAELDAMINGPWVAEATGQYNRFQSDSVCNPDTILERNWNHTLLTEVEHPIGGALLVHGLSDSPYSMRAIAQRLNEEGYTVIALRVPGHGTCPAALAEVSWEDWAAAVRVAARGLRKRLPDGAPLVLGGYSNGGALVVHYAIEAIDDEASPRPDAIILFSPMIGITSLAKLMELNGVIAKMSGEPKARWSSIETEINPFKYSSWPMNASVQAWQLTRRIEAKLSTLQASGRMGAIPPILAMQSALDSTVIVPALITTLFDRLTPGSSELVLYDANRSNRLNGLIDHSYDHQIRPLLSRTDRPFTLTLVVNVSPDSLEVEVVSRVGESITRTSLGTSWPEHVYSLSHEAIPFPPDDPLVGDGRTKTAIGLSLGSLSLRGENGFLTIPTSFRLRQLHNPFYYEMEDHIINWLKQVVGDSLFDSSRDPLSDPDNTP